MRRSTARGRVFPQFYSTDRRYARLSLKSTSLYPLMWANADDQGRLCGDPEEIKYTCCPNLDHITKADIPQLLEELATQNLILRYNTPKTAAIQLLDWWNVHLKMQWAWQSDYSPPDSWNDHLRYKKSAKEVETLNWPVSGETPSSSQVSTPAVSGEKAPADEGLAEEKEIYSIGLDRTRSKILQRTGVSPPHPESETETETEEGVGNSPETSQSAQVRTPPPSPSGFCTDRNKISSDLIENFQFAFGRVEAKNPRKVIPREPTAKELAQLRDLAEELVAAGGCPLDYIRQAFREAAGQETKSKMSISYVRAIMCDWLGMPKGRPL